MAGTDPQKHLLTLIHDFATEKSQGERRVGNHKKQIQELQSELETANLELEQAKCLKDSIEQEIKGYEVELAMNDTSIQTLEARISVIQDEVTTAGSDLEALKNEEAASIDQFIGKMFELNAKIRKFQQEIVSASKEVYYPGISNHEASPVNANSEDAEDCRRALEIMLSQITSQISKEEQEYELNQKIYLHLQVKQELNDLEQKVSLMETIMKETKEVEELTSSELEHTCATLSDELQKRCICPNCHHDNVEVLGGILQMNNGS